MCKSHHTDLHINCTLYSISDKVIFSSPQRGQILYNWTIEDFNILHGDLQVQLKSLHFNSSLSLTNWRLLAKVDKQHLVISLQEAGSSEYTFWASDCSVLLPELTPPVKQVGNDQRLGGSRQLSIQVPKQSLPDVESINVTFAVTITSNLCQHFCIGRPYIWKQSPLHRMKDIFNNEKFCDTELSVGEKKFKVHKAILASVSEVFHKMFDSEMQEKATGVVEISDIDSAVMSDLLMYAYTGTAPHITQHAMELMIAADKYCMLNLINICTKHLLSKMSLENAAEILLLANSLPSGLLLKSKCMNFIRTNLSSVSKTQSWQQLVNTSSKLVLECM